MRRPALCVVLIAALWATGCTTTTTGLRSAVGEPIQGEGFAGSMLDKMSTEELAREGAANLAQGKLTAARMVYSKLLAREPGSLEALRGFGNLAYRTKDYEEARKIFAKTVLIDPTTRSAVGLGRVCRALGRYEEAVEHLRAGIEIDPHDPSVLIELGITLDAGGDPGQANVMFERAWDIAPDSASVLNNLGFNLMVLGRHGDAIHALEKALRLSPGSERIRSNLAIAYALEGKRDKASRIFGELVGQAGALNNLGFLSMVSGDCRGAHTALTSALEASTHHYQRAKGNLEKLGNWTQCGERAQ